MTLGALGALGYVFVAKSFYVDTICLRGALRELLLTSRTVYHGLLQPRYPSSSLFRFYFGLSVLKLNIRQKGTLMMKGSLRGYLGT